jgi:hypothetical protein
VAETGGSVWRFAAAAVDAPPSRVVRVLGRGGSFSRSVRWTPDLRHRAVALHRHGHVGRLEIAMDHALLVRVLHAVADLREQLQALPHRQFASITVRRDRLTLHVLHHEVRAALRRELAHG